MPAPILLAGLLAAAAAVPKPARPWSDDILYFVLVDRFADGDPGNDANVDRRAKGAFHGGDLKGLLAQLDEIASLGVTAIWVNPLVKNIPGHVDGAGFPDWGYHGYWADDFNSLDPRFGTEEDLRKLVEACHAGGSRSCSTSSTTMPGTTRATFATRRPGSGCAPPSSAIAERTTSPAASPG